MKKTNLILQGLFGIAVFLFFYFLFPHHLHYQEQFQLFLFTKAYFLETCARPGGFSNYAGRFFTQFYLYAGWGALIVSLSLVAMQQLVYAIGRRFKQSVSAGWFLSFLPALFYWYLLCDENSQFGGVAASLLVLLFTLIATYIQSDRLRRIYLIIMIPLLYWMAGIAVTLAVVILLGYEWMIIKREKKWLSILSIVSVLLVIACPFIAKYFIVHYPLERLAWGVDYVHFTTITPVRIIILWILTIVATLLLPYFPKITKPKLRKLILPVQAIGLILIAYILIGRMAYPSNASREEIMAYDYYSKTRNWNKIIQMANRKSPGVPMTVACLNLALYKTGQLPEKMFNYFQNGPEGLLPTFQRDFMIPTVTGEIYYYLGFVNTAQRFAFEAMEALPDYQKSVRSIKRLAETNLINGQYAVADKYLSLLENTLFYRNWAKETRAYLYSEDKINAHPEWGELRRFQTTTDFLVSEKEKDMMLGIFFQQDRDNRMAYEYLLAYSLLTKDIKNFPNYFRMKTNFSYPAIPKSYQEALIYIWGLSHNELTDSIPFPVSNSVKQEVEAYANTYTNYQSPEPFLRKRFSKTWWYYLHFRKYNQPNRNTPYQY